MKYIKNHKLTVFIIFVYTITIVGGYVVYNYFNIGSNLPSYGDRLDGIDAVKITEEQENNIKAKISEQTNVLNVNTNLSGRTFNVVILVGDTAPYGNDIKGYANFVSEGLTPEQNNFYDLQVFIYKKYHCTLTASGKTDEDGNFTNNVVVKFKNDINNDKYVIAYGITNSETKDYNKKSEFTINDDGEFVIYGFTQDKLGESSCSIKVVKKTAADGAVLKDTTINSSDVESFPIIGYKRRATEGFVWTKDR